MASQLSGYQQFRQAADKLRQSVVVAATVEKCKPYLQFVDTDKEENLKRAVSIAARASAVSLTAEEFSQAVILLKKQVSTPDSSAALFAPFA